MHALDDYFNELLRNIEPAAGRVKQAAKAHKLVRDHLRESEDVTTVEPHSWLSGSYARNTAIGEIDDVDILLRLDADYLHLAPRTVLAQVKSALENLDDVSRPVDLRSQRRSVRAHLDGYDVYLDVVPVVAPNGDSTPLWIPDKSQRDWVESHPLGYGEKLSALNTKRERKVVPLIKMVKHWRDEHIRQTNVKPKSYWLECMVFQVFDGGAVSTMGKGYALLVRDVLVALYNRCESAYRDPDAIPRVADPLTGKIVTAKWQREHFERFMSELAAAAKSARSAVDAEEKGDAITYWRRVFGEAFPECSVADSAAAVTEALARQSVYVTSAGRVLTSQPAQDAVVPRPTRFYGGGRKPRFPRQRTNVSPAIYVPGMSRHFPQFRYQNQRGAAFVWLGTLKPTEASPEYRVRVRVRQRRMPRLFVESPQIDKRVGHLYDDDGSLCLYYPDDKTWLPGRPLTELVALAAVWLWFYEAWLKTGRWFGPEVHPQAQKAA